MAHLAPGSPVVDVQAGLPKRQQGHQHTMLNRLQGLLSPHQHTSSHSAMNRPGDNAQQINCTSTPLNSRQTAPIDSKFLKIRLLTWNMHDSVPKGDLEELLGKVPAYNGTTAIHGAFLHLPNDGNHPYHLVIVAGQECPTPSGIPMGLGAGFKILDKDRDKSKDPEKDHDKASSKMGKDKHDDSRSHKHDDDFEGSPSGWTSVVEDWLSNGSGYCRTSSPTTADVGFPRPLMRQKSSKDSRKGPYQLLIKDRLMGIYLAVYIHRDLKPFVQGTSKSAVTAGLIGGRVGNKGGVGISLKIDGTTFLFLNAHLAAHEGKLNHRLANLAKIKAELSVDDFLPGDDPRKVSEDLTDRFDFAFICGDLNFRLMLSRLHADWLIAKKDYAQAFKFDQLHALMENADTFSGFHEAPIDFPPTFKYDVVRSNRRSKLSSLKRDRGITHVPEIEIETEEPEMQDDDDGDDDMMSVLSTVTGTTSINSNPAIESNNDDTSGLALFPPTPTSKVNSTSKISVVSSGVHKTKFKFLSLLSPSSTKLLRATSNPEYLTPMTPTTPVGLTPPISPIRPGISASTLEISKKPRPPPMNLGNNPEYLARLPNAEDDLLVEKGVYDSSSKKRVPSWCDRILWKTTIAPPPPPHSEEYTYGSDLQRPRNRMGQFFANAFRPSRVDSNTPSTSTFSGESTPTTAYNTPHTRGHIHSHSEDNRQSAGISYTRFRGLSTPDTPSHTYQFSPHRAYTSFSPPSTAPLLSEMHTHPRRATDAPDHTIPLDRPQSATHQQTLWRFLPSFLSPTHAQGPLQDTLPAPIPPPSRRGEVICHSYNTLDDRAMRRLEGRSDHRPVIGTYTVYV